MGDENLRNKLLAGRRRSRTVATKEESAVTDVVEKVEELTTQVPESGEDVPIETVSLPRSSGRDRTAESMASVAEGTNFIATLARHLGAGNTLAVYIDPNNDDIVRIEILKGTGLPVPKKNKLGNDYYVHVHDPAYWPWEYKWRQLSMDDKVEYAKKLGVIWEEHENPKINNMRLTEAVRLHEGIEKYKPEYATVALRKVAKNLYLADQLDMSDSS